MPAKSTRPPGSLGRALRALAATAFAVAFCLVVVSTGLAAYPDSFERVRSNPADALAERAIDERSYDRASRCLQSPRAGMVAFQRWLERNAGGSSWGIMRCEDLGSGSKSLHSEGRALDWHLDASNPRHKREAIRVISMLLAPDALGNEHALARRMGIQEIIYDCKAWFSHDDSMHNYSVCYSDSGKRRRSFNRTAAHQDHIHFGMNRAGAAKRTSFWTRSLPPRVIPTSEIGSASTRATLSRRSGRMSVRLRCDQPGPCAGWVRLAVRTRGKTVTIGRAHFAFVQHGTEHHAASTRLSPRGLERLGRKSRIRIEPEPGATGDALTMRLRHR
ncbi:MAG: hypothetical protein ACR2NA_01215 [Solirubrobacterales bacterium]